MDAPLSGSSVAEALGNAFRLSTDRERQGQDAFSASPFSRLLITHVLSVGGDALVTLALAGSLFFSTPLHAARGRVALTLLLTIAPFAVVAPLLGPIIDRAQSGRRAMVVATAVGRAVACYFMARYINSPLLFPAAFLTLVCSKGYTVAKATLVPSAVRRPQDLVEANSKLAVSGAIAGFLTAIPGVAILKLADASWVLRLDIVLFLACAATAARLQVTERGVTTGEAGGATEVLTGEGAFTAAAAGRQVQGEPLPPGAIQVAAFAMGTLRLIVGLLTFLVAFGFRNDHAPAWWYGVVLAASIGGNLVGAAFAPWLRSRLREELILAGSTAAVAAAGIAALLFSAVHSRPAAAVLAGIVGLSAGAAKLSFDALVQRHIPAARQGRAFGRFEAGFQLVWVFGGLIPVVIAMALPAGFVVVTVAAAVAAIAYVVGTRMARRGRLPSWWPGVTEPRPRRRGGRPGDPGGDGATVPFPRPPSPPAVPFVSPDGPTVQVAPLGTLDHAAPSSGAQTVVRPYDDQRWMDPSPGRGTPTPPTPPPVADPPPDLGTYPPAIDRPPDLGTYPPVIDRPAPLRHGDRPIPPPLVGPPPLAAPLAPRPPQEPPPE